MKKFLAAFTTALLAVGIAVVGVSAPATAASTAVPSITSTCAALTVDLSGYADTVPAQPAVYHDWTETVTDVAAIPAKPAVTHVEYEWMTWYRGQFVTKWAAENPSSWNAWWWKTGDSRTVIDTPAQDAVPAVTHTVPHHDLVTAAVPEKTNSVVVSIDGTEKANTTFGTSYSSSFTYPADFQTHHYSVQVTAWNGDGSISQTNVASGACSTAPVASLDHLGACYGNNGFSSENVYVKLDNSASELPVTFTGNGINQTVPAGTIQVAEATPMWDRGGSFDVTAAGKTFTIVVDSFADCGRSVTPYVQGPWVGTCQLPTTTRTVEFWFDNTGSNRPVEYFVNGVSAGTAPAGQKIHFDAAAAPMAGATYNVTADGRSWSLTVPASDCLTLVTPVAPAVTPATTCGVYDTLTPATTPGVLYVTTFDSATGKYTVTATPELGYKFAGTKKKDQTVVFHGKLKMVKCVIDAVLTSSITTVCGSADVLVTNTALSDLTTRAKAGVAKVWVDGVLSDRIRVTSGSDLTKTIGFAEDSTYNGGTQHSILVKFGATQLAAATVESNCLPPVPPVVNPPAPAPVFFATTPTTPTTPTTTAPSESLTTLALLPADATATDEVCTPSGKTTSGYITVALLPEDQTAVQYSVDGTALTSAKTEMKPGSYTVTASARDSGESVATSSWNLTIASADCAALATLATQPAADNGSGFPVWALLLAIFLLLLLLGIVFFLIARRRRREAGTN